MEILTTFITSVLLLAIIGSPFLVLFLVNKKNIRFKFLAYLTYGIILSLVITSTFAWWGDASNQILLSHYGYDFNTWNVADRIANVAEENLVRVENLRSSMMGIGWTLKTLMIYIFYFPYLILVYLGAFMFKRNRKELTPNNL